MGLTFEDVRKVLIENDPEGLLRMGAPSDEYDSEAKLIYRSLASLTRKPDFNYIVELVKYIFYTRFDCDSKGEYVWGEEKKQFSWLHDNELKADFIAFELHSIMK